MKKIRTILCVIVFKLSISYHVNAQKLIRVDSIPINELKKDFPFAYSLDSIVFSNYFKIAHIADENSVASGKYFNYFGKIEPSDTLQVIEELLALKGDKRACAVPIAAYSVNALSYYPNRFEKFCTIEVEALFLVEYIIESKPLKRLPYPILRSIKSDHVVQNEYAIEKAYESYRKWFKKIKKYGLHRAKKKGFYPLKHSGLRWYL